MKTIKRYLYILLAAVCVLSACEEKTVEEVFDVEFNVPSSITFEEGDDRIVDFKVLFKKAPKASDIMILKAGTSVITCPLLNVSESKFSVQFPQELAAATYEVKLRRGDKEYSFGNMKVIIYTEGSFKPAASTTVWGVVRCGTEPIPGVVVSDGIEVAVTNAEGIYELDSEKPWGYVFVSIPSGYEVATKGVLPQFYYYLEEKPDIMEQVDFELTKVENQDNYKMLFFGDMHLADRTSDRNQFAEFTADVKKYMAANAGTNIYALTLGDMTWDIYWYSNSYSFTQYVNEINNGLSGLKVFHTMGNHDNDYTTFSDYDAALSYVKGLCPTYYSFNIGKVHYVVLDDIDCSKYDGTKSRNYVKNLSQDQLDWLKKDLAHVDKSTPIIVTAHAQFFYPASTTSFKIDQDATSTKKFFDITKGYKVHIVTGHTHKTFNVLPKHSKSLGADNVYEHNAGAVCGSWWWSGHLTDGIHLCQDGTPGGYSIWDINGTDLKWKYKATNWDESYQFRAYDLNNVSFSFDDVPKMQDISTLTKEFGKYVSAYPGTQNNEVLINIWNWSADWTLSVTDANGKELKATRVYAYDPLHIKAMSIKRFNSSSITSVPSFVTDTNMNHFFKVTADDPNVDLTIKVTDGFGNVYTENMDRPKAFNMSDYKK